MSEDAEASEISCLVSSSVMRIKPIFPLEGYTIEL